MSIIIDTNTLAPVFDSECELCDEFRPVFDWVKCTSEAVFVYGGTTYKTELLKAKRYFKILSLFKSARKVVEINDALIDQYEKALQERNHQRAFNDKHIVAIIAISGCRLLCSKDAESYQFVKDKEFYPEEVKRPKIYSGKRNSDLLTIRNIVKLKNRV